MIDKLNNSFPDNNSTRTIAIVSGKGGSGKTLVAVTLANILASNGHPTTLIDCDFGTGGLTYYLGLNMVKNISIGMSDLIPDQNNEFSKNIEKVLQQITPREQHTKKSDLFFIGIGDHRELIKRKLPLNSKHLSFILTALCEVSEFVIIDCRGGIDEDSIEVCQAVDDILIVAETDTTSFQTTYFLTETISSKNMGHKLKGFFINKVFDNPSAIAKNGTGLFKSQFLTAIPFDLSTTRRFLSGDMPSLSSPFCNQLWAGLIKAYGNIIPDPPKRVLSFDEFKELNLTNMDSLRGGRIISIFIIYLCVIFYFFPYQFEKLIPRYSYDLLPAVFSILALSASFETTRIAIGRTVNSYNNLLRKLLLRLKSK